MIAEEHNGRRVEEAWCATLTLPRVQSVRVVFVLVDLGRHDLFLHFPLSPLHSEPFSSFDPYQISKQATVQVN